MSLSFPKEACSKFSEDAATITSTRMPPMKAALLATVCAGAFASSASAVDLRVRTELGQTLEINDNRNLSNPSLGFTYAPVSSLLLDVLARTPTMRFEASGNLNYRTYFGPGAVNTLNGLDKDAQARITKTTKLTTYDIGASYSQRDATSAQLDDTGFATVSGDIITYALNGGLRHQFGPRDTFAFSARGSSVSFSSPTQSPYDDFTSTAIWTRRANRALDLNALVNYYLQDRATSDITIWKATGGVNARLSPRLTLVGSAGAAFLNAVASSGAIPLPLGSSSSGSAVGWIGDILVSYRLRITTRVSVAAARSIAPDSLGNIQSRDTINAVWTEEVNRRSALTFATGLSRSGGGGGGGGGIGSSSGTSEFFNASASYAYRLTPEIYSNIAYRYAQRSGGGSSGTARSNSIFMSLRRSVTIVP
jgi:hypothetical protein